MIELKPYILPEAHYYKVFIESDGNEAKITTSDIKDVTVAGQWVTLPNGFKMLDIIEDIHVVPGTAVNRVIDIRINANGTESFFIPAAAAFDYATFYVLGYTD